MRVLVWFVLAIILSASAAHAGTYACSVSGAELGYLEEDWARNPAFPTKPSYIQGQLDTALARMRNGQQRGAEMRATVAAKVAEPTAKAVACTVTPADEALLDTLLPTIPTRQDKIHLVLWSQFKQVRDRAQRNAFERLALDGKRCLDVPGQIFTASRNVTTQALEWSCQ